MKTIYIKYRHLFSNLTDRKSNFSHNQFNRLGVNFLRQKHAPTVSRAPKFFCVQETILLCLKNSTEHPEPLLTALDDLRNLAFKDVIISQ